MKRIVEEQKIVKGKRGGWRPNSGRKKGSMNVVTLKMNKEINKYINAQKKEGRELIALDVFQGVYRAPQLDPAIRLRAAQQAMPYESHKLSSTEMSGPDGGAIEHRYTNAAEELKRRLITEVQPELGKQVD